MQLIFVEECDWQDVMDLFCEMSFIDFYFHFQRYFLYKNISET